MAKGNKGFKLRKPVIVRPYYELIVGGGNKAHIEVPVPSPFRPKIIAYPPAMDKPKTFTDDDFNEAEQDNYIDEFDNKEHE